MRLAIVDGGEVKVVVSLKAVGVLAAHVEGAGLEEVIEGKTTKLVGLVEFGEKQLGVAESALVDQLLKGRQGLRGIGGAPAAGDGVQIFGMDVQSCLNGGQGRSVIEIRGRASLQAVIEKELTGQLWLAGVPQALEKGGDLVFGPMSGVRPVGEVGPGVAVVRRIKIPVGKEVVTQMIKDDVSGSTKLKAAVIVGVEWCAIDKLANLSLVHKKAAHRVVGRSEANVGQGVAYP